jgi:hypothetical protein
LFRPRGRRQVVFCNFSGLNARQQPPAESHSNRSGNHEQIAPAASAEGSFNSAIEGSGTEVWIIGAPVNLVYDPSLGWLGNGRHGEIGVAAQVAQQGDLAFYATKFAIGV